jgi:hypothetical protein
MSSPDEMVETRYQISCWGEDYSDARSVADAVRGALSNFSGVAASITIDHATIINETDLPAYGNESDKITRFGKGIDFIIWFRE